MAVSKRLRYEILRRDNHTCRYCGATAPDAPLRVDHVIPRALGGTDAPTNLVTACEPCNSGKTSSLPTGTTVADIDQETFRQAAAAQARSAKPVPSHDPETGMPTSWTFREVELALVGHAWEAAWRIADPEGPSVSDYENFSDQQKQLTDRGVDIGTMFAAAVMAGSQRSTSLIWGVPSEVTELRYSDEEFGLGCDVVHAWEATWQEVAHSRPSMRDMTLFFEDLTNAIKAGYDRDTLLAAAKAAGVQRSFYLPNHLPQLQVAGGRA